MELDSGANDMKGFLEGVGEENGFEPLGDDFAAATAAANGFVFVYAEKPLCTLLLVAGAAVAGASDGIDVFISSLVVDTVLATMSVDGLFLLKAVSVESWIPLKGFLDGSCDLSLPVVAIA